MYGQSAYRDNQVLTAPREQLVPLLYQGLIKNLRRAAKEIDAGDLEAKATSLQKASDIVYELLASLDFEAGGELASRLAGLYGFFAREILEVGRSLDATRLSALIEMIEGLHSAWEEATRTVEGGGAA